MVNPALFGIEREPKGSACNFRGLRFEKYPINNNLWSSEPLPVIMRVTACCAIQVYMHVHARRPQPTPRFLQPHQLQGERTEL